MNLDEAIKNLNAMQDNRTKRTIIPKELTASEFVAIQLGIEALELKNKLMHLIAMGQSNDIIDNLILKPLPSETELKEGE